MKIFNECNLQVAWIVGKINPPTFSATCIVKGTYQLYPEEKAKLVKEQEPPLGDLFVDNDMDKSCIHESDFACFKPRTDLALFGKCHAIDNQPVKGCRVTFRVGEIGRSLFIFGNRQWEQSIGNPPTISDPAPFTEMSLIYENSFGGFGFPNNPHGKGWKKTVSETGLDHWPLPNIEDPRNLITTTKDQPTPAGFGPLGRMWPMRTAAKMGTYDDNWLKERWPYYPEDFDWGYYNCAAPEMQVSPYLRGDESLFFENLHPNISQYHSRLPGIRPRCIIDERVSETERFREVKLNLDTLWVDLESEQLQLIWRGVVDIEADNLDQIQHCLIVQELLEQEARPSEEYIILLRQQLDEELQESVEGTEELLIEPMDESWIQEMEVDFGRMEKEFKEIEKQAKQAEISIHALLEEAGVDQKKLHLAKQAAQKMSLKDLLTFGAREEEKLRNADPELAKKLPPPMTAEEIDEVDRSLEFAPMPDFEDFPEPLTRETCEKLLVERNSIENANLSKLDLSGLDFSGSNCRNVDFQGADLTSVNFAGTDLSGSNLALCDLSSLNFRGACLVEADLTEVNLCKADLTEAVIDDADFSEAVLDHASLVKVNGFRTIFVGASLNEVDCSGARFEEADFEGAYLEAANFKDSLLREASMEGVQGKGINMQSADLTGLHASEGSDFSDGIFINATAPGSIWEDGVLDRADFSAAQLMDADFTNTSLTQALFYRADMRLARLERANLTDTTMALVNLFQGSLEKAKLIRTNFRDANLYEVSFYLSVIENAEFKGANLNMTMLANNL